MVLLIGEIDLPSTLCKYDLGKVGLIVLSWVELCGVGWSWWSVLDVYVFVSGGVDGEGDEKFGFGIYQWEQGKCWK